MLVFYSGSRLMWSLKLLSISYLDHLRTATYFYLSTIDHIKRLKHWKRFYNAYCDHWNCYQLVIVIEANKYSSVLIAINISKKIDYSYRLVSVISLSRFQSDHINQLPTLTKW